MIIKGTAIVEKASLYKWDRNRGPSVTRVFEGRMAEILNLYPTLTAFGEAESVEVSDKGDGTAILYAIYFDDWDRSGVGAAGFTNQFELLGNDLMKDVFLNPKSKQIDYADRVANTTTAAIIDEIRKQSTATGTYSSRLEQVQLTYGTISAPVRVFADQLFYLSTQRQDSYAESQFVFRQTKTVGSRYTGTLDMTNLNGIYSTSEMISEITSDGSIIPDIYLARLGAIPAPSFSFDTNWFYWGWLKKTPVTSPNSLNREQIVQEWWLEIWSLYHYDRKA